MSVYVTIFQLLFPVKVATGLLQTFINQPTASKH